LKKYKIEFVREQKVYDADEGMTVLAAEIAAGIVPDAPCGGTGACGKCEAEINGRRALACQVRVEQDMQVYTRGRETSVQFLMEGRARRTPYLEGGICWGNPPEDIAEPLLAAVDLGSTSIAAYLLDGRTGKPLAARSRLNPQRQYGADVVQRAGYAMTHGAARLSGCVREAADAMLAEMAEACGASPRNIVRVTMVGNTCMHHLFLEFPTDTLVLSPYTPKVKAALTLPACCYGLHVHPEAELIWLPNIGGFVGADTAACILAAEFDRREKLTLLVDIGTNGEIVLGDRRGISTCATAAGPAFEGAKITCGMRGSRGAIDHVWLEDGRLAYHVIGECEPSGICGSGLLDAAHCLLRLGCIDEGGRMENAYYFTDTVFIEPKDIRELQLAKAAVAAGIEILCQRRGVRPGGIQEVLLAGAFGSYLDPDSACGIGLLPPALRDRIVSVGNAAGEGARLAALSQRELDRSKASAAQAEFVELALDPDFQDVFIDNLSFEEGQEV